MKRILAFLVALSLAISLLPATIYAENQEPDTGDGQTEYFAENTENDAENETEEIPSSQDDLLPQNDDLSGKTQEQIPEEENDEPEQPQRPASDEEPEQAAQVEQEALITEALPEAPEEDPAPILTAEPLEDALIQEDGTAVFHASAAVSPEGDLAYQWQLLDEQDLWESCEDIPTEQDREAAWTDLTGETGSSLSLSGITYDSYMEHYGYLYFRCSISAQGAVCITGEASLVPLARWTEELDGDSAAIWEGTEFDPLESVSLLDSMSGNGVGDYANVVVFVSFSDTDHASCKTGAIQHCIQDTDGAAQIKEYFDHRSDNSSRSLKEYLAKVSNGKCRVTNYYPQISGSTVGQLQISLSASAFQNFDDDYKILAEVQNYLNTALSGTADNLSHVNSGYMDHVMVVLCGDVSNFRAHESFYPNGQSSGGLKVGSYALVQEQDILNYVGGAGTITHEFMHSLGFKDLYCDGSNPVGRWDIMSSASDFMLYPLSWMRYAVSGWLSESNFQTVTENGTYTIYAPTRDTGAVQKQALILKTPYSDSEFFVVEYRISEVSSVYGAALDSKVPGTGLVVYRVNTAVEMDNKGGVPYYLYVFRDGDTQANGGGEINASYLGSSMSRGSSDSALHTAGGAITYADDTNSGIIVTAGTVGEDSVQVQVTFSDIITQGWDSATGDLSSVTATAMGSCQDSAGNIYLVVGEAQKTSLYQGETEIGTIPNLPLDSGEECACAVAGDYLYLLTSSNWTTATLRRVPLNNPSSVETIKSWSNVSPGYLAMASDGSTVAFGFIANNNKLQTFTCTGTTVTELAAKTTSNFYGGLQIAADGNGFYAAYRETGAEKVFLSKLTDRALSEVGSVQPSGTAGNPALTAGSSGIYLAVSGSSQCTVYQYTGGALQQTAVISEYASDLSIAAGADAQYVIGSWNGSGLELYRISGGAAEKAGTPLTSSCTNLSALSAYSAGNLVYSVYLKDGKPNLKSLQLSAAAHTHTPVSAGNAKAAACTAAGYTGDTVCSVCKATVQKGTTIQALGHSWGTYVSDHNATQQSDGTKTASCTRSGCTAKNTVTDPGSKLPIPKVELPIASGSKMDTVCVDGVNVSFSNTGTGIQISAPDSARSIVTAYSTKASGSSDRHNQYPVSMKAWIVQKQGSSTTVKAIPEFDDLLQYSGCSIRITGVRGIRMITSINVDKKNALINGGLGGYTIVENGTLLALTSQLGSNPLVLGSPGVKSNYAYKRSVADPVFNTVGKLTQYTNVLVGFNEKQCAEDIAMRPYMIVKDSAGNRYTVYGGVVYRSIGFIAYQNRNVFTPGGEAYQYVWNLIHLVYGSAYDSEYKR